MTIIWLCIGYSILTILIVLLAMQVHRDNANILQLENRIEFLEDSMQTVISALVYGSDDEDDNDDWWKQGDPEPVFEDDA